MAIDCTLHQFNFSHFNEKARWVLDLKGVPHRRNDLLPGPHAGAAKKISGQSQVPILEIDGDVIAGSSAIVEAVDARFPEPALFPSEVEARAETVRWMAWLDDEVGPAVRLSLFHTLLPETRDAVAIFAGGQSAWKRAPYGLVFPMLVPRLNAMMNITEETAAAADEVILKSLDRVADAVRETGYLVGERFAAADLTAAALFMPLCMPEQGPVDRGRLSSPRVDAWLSRWSEHEAIAWTRRMFANHRTGV